MPEISDSIKLKRLVAFSCDFMIIILEDKDLFLYFLLIRTLHVLYKDIMPHY